MEDINFASLAPRHGTRPFMGTWNEIGTSQLNGGAFNWSSVWSGLKNFGSTLRTYGNKAWNSSTGQLLREKLKDQNFQQKVVDGLASGINSSAVQGREAAAARRGGDDPAGGRAALVRGGREGRHAHHAHHRAAGHGCNETRHP